MSNYQVLIDRRICLAPGQPLKTPQDGRFWAAMDAFLADCSPADVARYLPRAGDRLLPLALAPTADRLEATLEAGDYWLRTLLSSRVFWRVMREAGNVGRFYFEFEPESHLSFRGYEYATGEDADGRKATYVVAATLPADPKRPLRVEVVYPAPSDRAGQGGGVPPNGWPPMLEGAPEEALTHWLDNTEFKEPSTHWELLARSGDPLPLAILLAGQEAARMRQLHGLRRLCCPGRGHLVHDFDSQRSYKTLDAVLESLQMEGADRIALSKSIDDAQSALVAEGSVHGTDVSPLIMRFFISTELDVAKCGCYFAVESGIEALAQTRDALQWYKTDLALVEEGPVLRGPGRGILASCRDVVHRWSAATQAARTEPTEHVAKGEPAVWFIVYPQCVCPPTSHATEP